MSTSKLETILEDVKPLTPEEQQKVRAWLDSLATKSNLDRDAAIADVTANTTIYVATVQLAAAL